MAYNPLSGPPPSLAMNPSIRSSFATTQGWQPRNLAQRTREQAPLLLPPAAGAATAAPPVALDPSNLLGFPGAKPRPASTMPELPPAGPTKVASVAGLGGAPAGGEDPYAMLRAMAAGGAGGSTPGLANVDFALLPTRPPAASTDTTLTGLLTQPAKFGGAPAADPRGPLGPGYLMADRGQDPAGRPVLKQSAASRAAAPRPTAPVDPAARSAAFASEAARRAVAEGRDPVAARKAAEAILPGPAAPTMQTTEVGGRKLAVGPGDKYFDAETGQPVDFTGEQPLSASDWLLSGQPPERYLAYREAFARALKGPADGDAPMGGGAAATPDLSKPVSAEQARKLPKGTRFIGENGKAYTVK